MTTINILSNLKAYQNTMNVSVIENLISELEKEYIYEQEKKKGGTTAVKRQKTIEKILKQNAKNEWNKLLSKCFTMDLNGETMQICFVSQGAFIALNSQNSCNVPEWDKSAEVDSCFSVTRRFIPTDLAKYERIETSPADVKVSFETWKKQQKQFAKDARETRFAYLCGNFTEFGFNAELLLNIFDVLGTDIKVYQNKVGHHEIYIESEIGKAVLMPIRIN